MTKNIPDPRSPLTIPHHYFLSPYAYIPLRYCKVNTMPVEIFSEIFQLTTQENPRNRVDLMLVCRRWHAIMLSTPGIHAQLQIRRSTQKKDVDTFGRTWLLYVTVDMRDEGDENDFNTESFYACFNAVAQGASRWRSLVLISPLTYPMLYRGQPDNFHVFQSLKILRISLSQRMDREVNILPHLQRLETFEAQHLCLPIYPPDTQFPMTQTLHVLRLKCVSIQWMDCHAFPALEICSIIFPPPSDAFRSVNMPSCSSLTYNSNNLGPLEHFHLPQLAKLEVKCDQWPAWRADLQLTVLLPIFVTAKSLTDLHLQVQCSGWLLVYMLRFVPALEKLWLGLASPHALSTASLQAFATGWPTVSEMTGQQNHIVGPVCRGLKTLHLHYKRWLRGLEKTDIIQTLGTITAHGKDTESDFSLYLSFDEGPQRLMWKVHEPAERPVWRHGTSIRLPSPHGKVTLSANQIHHNHISPLLRESDFHLTHLPVDFLLPFHNLEILEISGSSSIFQLSPNLCPGHTPKVHDLSSVQSSLLASPTVRKPGSCREFPVPDRRSPSQSHLIEMPFCTSLVLTLSRLATLKLPRISKLSVWIDHQDPNTIWEKRIAVNANLSGLRLLHVGGWNSSTKMDVLQVLRFLPALETLVITRPRWVTLGVDFFRAFFPVDVQGPSGMDFTSGEAQLSTLFWPRLESLQIEGIDLVAKSTNGL